jgi:hypothetical protein
MVNKLFMANSQPGINSYSFGFIPGFSLQPRGLESPDSAGG